MGTVTKSRCPNSSQCRARVWALRAFTLIELLVVIGVILLLVGLTTPALHKARSKAAKVECLSHLHSLASASASYSVEDSRSLLLPAHSTADENVTYDDGFFDYGGASGADDAWGGGRVGPSSNRAANTRPLNRLLGLDGETASDYDVFRCGADEFFDPPVIYEEDWSVWEDTLRQRSAFETVGASYWGNAVKGTLAPPSDDDQPVFSFGVYLRGASRIRYPSETVLYMEMPALFNMAMLSGDDGVVFTSLGLPGWHDSSPRFNFAFCDGHAADALLPAGWMSEPPPIGEAGELRGTGIRFDCFPDRPILDKPAPRARDAGAKVTNPLTLPEDTP